MVEQAHSPHKIVLLGWYELPAALAATPGCFGKTVKVEIGGHKGKMYLPQLDWSGDEPRVMAPAVSEELLKHIHHYSSHSDNFKMGRYWGSVNSWNPAERQVLKSYITSAILAFATMSNEVSYSDYLYGRGHPEGDLVKDLFHSVDAWFDNLRTWLEVRLDQDLDATHPLRGIEVQAEGFQILSEDEGLISLPASANEIEIHSTTDESVTLPLLRRAARQANKGLIPEATHLLLRDSRAAIRRKQYRRAAIDAGSALELVLADFNQAVTHVNFPKPPTLGTYVGHKVISQRAGLPQTLQRDVVKIRNDAIHHNKVPTRTEIDQAFTLASSVVNKLNPLPI